MNGFNNILLKTAAAVLAVTLAAGCVFEKENPVNDGELRSVMVQLGVSTDGGMTLTKAGETTEEGTSVENIIKTLRVYAYTGEQGSERLCGYLYVTDVTGVNSTTPKAYMMDLRLPYSQMNSTHDIIFKAVANEGAMVNTADLNITELGRDFDGTFTFNGNLAFDTFDAIQYTIPNQTFTTTEGTQLGMPMYYVSDPVTIDLTQTATSNLTAENAADHNGHTLVKTVPIKLTRSLSKIEVYAAEDAGEGTSGTSTAGIQITGVELTNVIADGPLFPGTASTTTLATNPALAGGAVTLAASEADKADPSKYTKVTEAYYLAENAAGETGKFHYGDVLDDIATSDDLKKATTLKIGYKVGETGEQKYGYVVMPPIQRNTYYKVLARIAAGGEMTLTFVVQPWEMFSEELEYGNNVSVGAEGRISWLEGVEPTAAAEVVTMGNNIRCEFTIDTPVYSTWEASFIPLEGDQNAFAFVKEVYDSATNTMVKQNVSTVSGNVGEKAELTITPLSKDLTQANKAILRIIVRTNEGRTIVVKNNILSGNTYTNDEYIIIHSM